MYYIGHLDLQIPSLHYVSLYSLEASKAFFPSVFRGHVVFQQHHYPSPTGYSTLIFLVGHQATKSSWAKAACTLKKAVPLSCVEQNTLKERAWGGENSHTPLASKNTYSASTPARRDTRGKKKDWASGLSLITSSMLYCQPTHRFR